MSKKENKNEKYEESKTLLIGKIKEFIDSGENPPWIRPWRTLGPARNPVTGTIYRGINVLILATAPFGDPRWITFNNGVSLGGKCKKGSGATRIWSNHPFKVTKEKEGEEDEIFFIKRPRPIAVFNVSQWEDLNLAPIPLPEKTEAFIDDSVLDGFFGSLPMEVFVCPSNKAFYNATKDEIQMPSKEQFTSSDEYYSTFFHELVHSTGHATRLNRPFGCDMDSPVYAYEELIAEFGASFLCSEFGINGMCQHPEYLRSWLKTLANDESKLFDAAKDAMKACNWVKENYFKLINENNEEKEEKAS